MVQDDYKVVLQNPTASSYWNDLEYDHPRNAIDGEAATIFSL